MEKKIEIEFKTKLTLEEYKNLSYLFTNSYFQTNYYFDTADYTLFKNKQTCRIREKENTFELTVKTKNIVGINEYNSIISENVFNTYMTKGFDLDYDFIKESNLKYIAKNITMRYELEIDSQLFCLDKVQIDDILYFELEMETTNHTFGQKYFMNFLNTHDIVYKENLSKSKYAILNSMNKS